MVDVEERSDADVVSLKGDIDLQTSPEVRKTLLACIKKGRPLVVDLGGVDYIDSSGVASLVEAFQAARAAGKSMVLARVSEAAMRVLGLARLDKVFPIAEDVDRALEKL